MLWRLDVGDGRQSDVVRAKRATRQRKDDTDYNGAATHPGHRAIRTHLWHPPWNGRLPLSWAHPERLSRPANGVFERGPCRYASALSAVVCVKVTGVALVHTSERSTA